MAIGAFLEPGVVVALLFGGAYFNRNKDYDLWQGKSLWYGDKRLKKSDDVVKRESTESLLDAGWSSSSSPTLAPHEVSTLRRRKIEILGYKRVVTTPNTLVFKDRFLSRVLQKFPFLAEAWYWALLYWVSSRLRAAPIKAVDYEKTNLVIE